MHVSSMLGVLFSISSSSSEVLSAAPACRDLGIPYVVPGWQLQSSKLVEDDIAELASTDYDTSSWYNVSSRTTLTAGLIEAGVFNDTKLFFSDNLEAVDASQFAVPWYYRRRFDLRSDSSVTTFLDTNGITSKADIYLNGKKIANNTLQAGAYGGHRYDISGVVKDGSNVLLIKAYPTDYDQDFAIGYVDWNPPPPDNGTGVWRDVQIKQTGPISGTNLRVLTNFTKPGDTVLVTIKIDILAKLNIESVVKTDIQAPDGTSIQLLTNISLNVGVLRTVAIQTVIQKPRIWWPRKWGDQPLYRVTVRIMRGSGILSDIVAPRQFGIRSVQSSVNEDGDIIFSINDQPFQVLGAGYAPDMCLRFDPARVTTQFQYVLDMGLNTIRLEGKQEQPELYDIASRLGLMILAGWECCDKWEAWPYNENIVAQLWDGNDYETARWSMKHEAAMMQSHPSMLGFMIGSDYWPDDRAAQIYVQTLREEADWHNPILAATNSYGYPELLGPSGMKEDGPYDWVSQNYWWYAAYGFGSELGSGVGTPELGSLKKFLSAADLQDLWKAPNKGLYHMAIDGSLFHDRSIYNQGLYQRYGAPDSLEDYLLKAQMMDYEATRAQFEAYGAKWNAKRPAAGTIYWMLNNAWPSLHWNLFDYCLHPAGAYFGAKVGSRIEHVAYDSVKNTVWLINHSLNKTGPRTIGVDLIDLAGKVLSRSTISVTTQPNRSKSIGAGLEKNLVSDVALLKLVLNDTNVLSRNVYWLSRKEDVLNFDNSTWYNTPVTSFANFAALNGMATADVKIVVQDGCGGSEKVGFVRKCVVLRNMANVPAVFVRLNLVDGTGQDVVPVFWSDNYLTLWPKEELAVEVEYTRSERGARIETSGKNLRSRKY